MSARERVGEREWEREHVSGWVGIGVDLCVIHPPNRNIYVNIDFCCSVL